MKTTILTVFFTILTFTMKAQNDTMYVMKNGNVTHKLSVKTADVDSIIFYRPDTISDIDGNVYITVIIGTQVWMAENLRTTKYADGTDIPLINTKLKWDSLTTTDKAYCWLNDDIANKSTYGALYTWAAAMNGGASASAIPSRVQGVCPTGWHLPSDGEWTQMESYLADYGYNYDGTTGGGRNKIAKSMASSSGWVSSSTAGAVGNTDFPAYRNKSGFTALPVGRRTKAGAFSNVGSAGYWWSTTEDGTDKTWSHYLLSSFSDGLRASTDKDSGISVRCLRD